MNDNNDTSTPSSTEEEFPPNFIIRSPEEHQRYADAMGERMLANLNRAGELAAEAAAKKAADKAAKEETS